MAGAIITNDLPFQTDYLNWADGREWEGLFADAGTGKTRMYLRRAERLHQCGKIDAVFILCINSLKTNFVAWPHMLEDGEYDAVSTHLGDDGVVKGVWISGASGRNKAAWSDFESKASKTDKLIVVVVNFEALLSEAFFAWSAAFMKEKRTYFVVDEGSRIGEPGSDRTKRAIKLAPLSLYRTDGTATPALKRPTKIFSQAKWLSPDALGFKSFYAFRNRYCKLGGFRGKQIVDYQNLDELAAKIDSWSFKVKIEDVREMPPREWKKHYVDMTKEQAVAYQTMRREFFAEFADGEITANIVLAQMTRLQQILGGYISKDGLLIEIIPPDRNPKIKEAWDIIDNASGQCLVWFRFKDELRGMASFLAEKGCSYHEFTGDYNDQDKLNIRKSFQRGDRRVLLGTASSGGIGVDEFKQASDAIFYSNDFDTERRWQTERRTYRIGVTRPVRYHDILVPNSVDTKIIKVLRGDAILNAKVMREEWKEWL